MRLIHLSDLHLGKRVNEFSMIEDQKYILGEILKIIDVESPDAVLIAGDVYDKTVPPVEAVSLLDSFLNDIRNRCVPVFIISGNHDSPERIAFGSAAFQSAGIHIAPTYRGAIPPFVLTDEYGSVNIYLLPFIKPIHVRQAYPESEVQTYTDAIQEAVRRMGVDTTQRNVIVAHQFVTGASRCDSEELSLGGSDNVDVTAFAPFDYVALGHIHGPQRLARDSVRYCGTPLKYSFSEVNDRKSVTLVDLKEKGCVEYRLIPLTPLRDMRELRGSYETLVSRTFYEDTNTQDYLRITLTDEEDVLDAMERLRVIYPNLMKLEYDNTRTRTSSQVSFDANPETKTPLQLFGEFYEQQNGMKLSEEQQAYLTELMAAIWEGK